MNVSWNIWGDHLGILLPSLCRLGSNGYVGHPKLCVPERKALLGMKYELYHRFKGDKPLVSFVILLYIHAEWLIDIIHRSIVMVP